MTISHYRETLHAGYGQQFDVKRVLFEEKTNHQHLIIFENPLFGRVMALDGVIQTTERDEFIYHEMLTHVPLFSHPCPKKVCVIGGGDGGILREVLRHSTVEQAILVEIDHQVVDMCREYFPLHSQGAFDDARVDIVIADGFDFVKTTNETFDVIIADTTDPMGPGEILFTHTFYEGCKRCLNDNGILVTQNGVSFFQLDEVKNTFSSLKTLFSDASFYTAAVPTYIGGLMSLGWATDNPALRFTPLDDLKARFVQRDFKTRYYTPELHQGAFALPAYIQEVLS